jgi:uncharacterized protein YydD (DUF2326 family)
VSDFNLADDDFYHIQFPDLDDMTEQIVREIERQEAMLTEDEIHNRYHYHAPSDRAKELHDKFNKMLERVAQEIERDIPEGRLKALAHTSNEQTKLWVNSAIAQNHDKL